MQDTVLPVETATSKELQDGRELAYNLASVVSGYGTQCLLSENLRQYYTGINAPTKTNLKHFDAVAKLLSLGYDDCLQLDNIRLLMACLDLDLGFGTCIPLDLQGQVLPRLEELRKYKLIGKYLSLIPGRVKKVKK